MANFKRDTLSSAGNARSSHMPSSNLSASNGDCPRHYQQKPPSAAPVQASYNPTWPANQFSGRAGHHQLPPAPTNVNFAQAASSPTHSVQGPRRPNYARPDPIDLWNCHECGHTNNPANCPVMCGDCPHQKCYLCPPTPPQHIPWTNQRRHFVPDNSPSSHHS